MEAKHFALLADWGATLKFLLHCLLNENSLRQTLRCFIGALCECNPLPWKHTGEGGSAVV